MGTSGGLLLSRTIANQIRSRILMSGPIPVADYMRLSLTQSTSQDCTSEQLPNNDQGYYMKKDVFGQKGDFITSPEISQMFGEVLGVWGIQSWRQLSGPKNKFNIVELGPGRGTLSRDLLRVCSQLESVIGENISLNLVEISPHLSKMQYELLCQSGDSKRVENDDSDKSFQRGISKECGYPVSWYKDIRDVPKEFNLYLAHEFFDALPIHKLQKVDKEWREVLVDINPDKEDSFRFVISRHETPVLKVLKSHYPQVLDTTRSHLEISLDALVVLEEVTSRLEQYGGIAVIVDYGHEGSKDDTFRAFQKHQLHDPLLAPGTADLTADVDFSIVKQLFSEKALICGPVTQQTFLRRLGIDLRLGSLLQKAKSEDEKEQLESGYKMIMDDMGTRFLFIGLFPKVLEQLLPKLRIAGFYQ